MKKSAVNMNIVRLMIAVAGIVALTFGLLQGGYQDTLQKAVRICLECIGIG